MNIGMIGYAKPDMETMLQAYAMHTFLKKYDADSYLVYDFNQKFDSVKKTKRGFVDYMLKRQWRSPSDEKANVAVKEFITKELKNTEDNTTDAYVMINNRAFADMNGKDVAFYDFYQSNLDKDEMITEAILLNESQVYQTLVKERPVKEKYLFLDCMDQKTPLLGFAQKYAQKHGLKIVSLVTERKFEAYESPVEVYDPGEYLAYLIHADMIVTDTFLSTEFAVLFHKTFISRDNELYPGKNRRFLSRLSLLGNFYQKTDLNPYESYNINHWAKIDQELAKIKGELLVYIQKVLKLKVIFHDEKVNCPTNILKSECCGCFACKEVCPVSAITMVRDNEGFYYPQVNDSCIHCNKCYKACVKNKNSQTIEYAEEFPKAICAINKNDDIRRNSSSGGVFYNIAKYAIEERQGVVFGVRWDEDMNAVSTMATTMEEAKAFSGSKYVKAEIDSVYKQVEEQLKANKFVVFSSLPCEAAGLKAYLGKEYDNLFLCEILCHAAPSPKVFKDYINFIEKKFKSKVIDVKFREKTKGWLIHQCNMVFTFKDREPLTVNARRNNYFRNFLKDNISRPGCAKCSFVGKNRVGDVTIGDFWGINKIDEELYDNQGASVVLINTQKGLSMWEHMKDDFTYKQKTFKEAFRYNHSKPMPLKDERNLLFMRYNDEEVNDLLLNFNDLKK